MASRDSLGATVYAWIAAIRRSSPMDVNDAYPIVGSTISAARRGTGTRHTCLPCAATAIYPGHHDNGSAGRRREIARLHDGDNPAAPSPGFSHDTISHATTQLGSLGLRR